MYHVGDIDSALSGWIVASNADYVSEKIATPKSQVRHNSWMVDTWKRTVAGRLGAEHHDLRVRQICGSI